MQTLTLRRQTTSSSYRDEPCEYYGVVVCVRSSVRTFGCLVVVGLLNRVRHSTSVAKVNISHCLTSSLVGLIKLTGLR